MRPHRRSGVEILKARDHNNMTQLSSPPSGALTHVWWSVGVLSLVLVALWAAGEGATAALRYEREAVIEGGQYWRLITAHLVHGGAAHLGLNVAGLLLIVLLFPSAYTAGAWCALVVFSAAAIAVGFLLREPELAWYVGLSGVLHGLLSAGAVAWWRTERPIWAAALSLFIAGKLLVEQFVGASPLAGMPVVVNAHLYGALGGLLGAGLLSMQRRWLSQGRSI